MKIEISNIFPVTRKLKTRWTHEAQQDFENMHSKPRIERLWLEFFYKKFPNHKHFSFESL